MRIKIDATVTIPPERLAEVRKFLGAETNIDIADAVRDEAVRHVVEYLNDNLPGLPAPASAKIRIGGAEVEV